MTFCKDFTAAVAKKILEGTSYGDPA